MPDTALPIIDDGDVGVSTPVVKRRVIGEAYGGVICETPVQRDRLNKDGEPILKGNGKARQELVVTTLALPGCTAIAGIGDEEGVPEAGSVNRIILRGGGFGQWIDAKKAHGQLHIGDVVVMRSEYAQQYDSNGSTVGPQITDQDTINTKKMAGQTVGVYGPLEIRSARPEEADWVTKAVAHYNAATAVPVADGPGPQGEPF